jgi:cytochrome c oxidase assembly protein subunit 15
LAYDSREYWIGKLDYIFYIHRSFSLVVTALCIYLFVQFKRLGIAPISSMIILFCVAGEIVLGIIMAYLNIPAFAQPLHLLLSCILFISLYNNWLKTSVKAA